MRVLVRIVRIGGAERRIAQERRIRERIVEIEVPDALVAQGVPRG